VSDARAEALSTVLEAAGNWLSELSQYIIPASQAADDGADYSEAYAKLEAALALLEPTPAESEAEPTSNLTPYDTGERLEPRTWVTSTAGVTKDNADDFGKVDFDADDGRTVATLWIERKPDGTYALKGYANEPLSNEIGES